MRVLPHCFLVLLIFLTGGCFTQSYTSKDDPLPDDRTVVFRLQDGSTITCPAGKHHRIDDGYEVIGMKSRETGPDIKYEGIILDEELTGITMQRFNPKGSAILVAGMAITLFLILTHWGRGGA